jgi:uncharacterized protein YrrD
MKKSEKILGYPVIDISSGEKLGRVKDFIFNGDSGTVDYLVVENDTGAFMAKVVSTADILGIGEYAVTIGSENAVKDLNSTVDAVRLSKKDIKIKDTDILTKKGTIIGQTGDLYIDEDDNCKIIGLEFISNESAEETESRMVLPAGSVITYGRDLIIVEEDALSKLKHEEELLNSGEKPQFDYSRTADVSGNGFAQDYAFAEDEASTAQNFESGADLPPEDYSEETEESPPVETKQPESAAELFEQRQRQYLVGRRATRTIVDAQGNVIVNEGMIINNEIITEAKKSGKLVELIMNNRE